MEITCYNEVRDEVIDQYIKNKKYKKSMANEEDDKEDDDEEIDIKLFKVLETL